MPGSLRGIWAGKHRPASLLSIVVVITLFALPFLFSFLMYKKYEGLLEYNAIKFRVGSIYAEIKTGSKITLAY